MRTMADLLESAGARVRGKRADCCFCTGHSRLTVAFDERRGVAFCHRCHLSLTDRQLANQQRVRLPARRIGRARIMKQRFHAWLNITIAEMSGPEHRLARRAEWAKAALVSFPDMDVAWNALAEWYHVRRKYELFWESACDRVGRFWLFRNWRKHA